jgi:tRNA(adenine34) deaminase
LNFSKIIVGLNKINNFDQKSMISPYNDEYFMRQALLEALKAFEMDEVPVGAVVVANNKIIARAHNLTEKLNDVTAHAEIQAITAATEFLGAKYLTGCTLYVTLEPCVMCGGALYWSQIDKVVFAARDVKRGAGKISESIYHPKTLVINGLLSEESASLLRDFFAKKRK